MIPFRVFSMHLRCCNCVRPDVRTVSVPRVEGAPTTLDEFIDSAAMLAVPFSCRQCESTSGVLVAVTMTGDEVEEHWEADVQDVA